jgi:hypothetical protein
VANNRPIISSFPRVLTSLPTLDGGLNSWPIWRQLKPGEKTEIRLPASVKNSVTTAHETVLLNLVWELDATKTVIV